MLALTYVKVVIHGLHNTINKTLTSGKAGQRFQALGFTLVIPNTAILRLQLVL